MPDWVVVLILGIVEGITEFLPVSSTGHLLLAEHWLGLRSPPTELLNVVIQSGAVLAVLLAFARRLGQMRPIAVAAQVQLDDVLEPSWC